MTIQNPSLHSSKLVACLICLFNVQVCSFILNYNLRDQEDVNNKWSLNIHYEFSIFFFHLMDMKIVTIRQCSVITNSQNGFGGGGGSFCSSMAIIKGIGSFDIDANKSVKTHNICLLLFPICFCFFDFALQTFSCFLFENIDLTILFVFIFFTFFDLKGSKLRFDFLSNFQLSLMPPLKILISSFPFFIKVLTLQTQYYLLLSFLSHCFFFEPYNSSLDESPLKKPNRSYHKS